MADEQAKKQSEAKVTGIVNRSAVRAETKQVITRSQPINVSRPSQKSNEKKN